MRIYIKSSLINSEHISLLAKELNVSKTVFKRLMNTYTYFTCFKTNKVHFQFTGLHRRSDMSIEHYSDSESFIKRVQQEKLLELL